jgi:hypothetical protein
VELLTRAFLTDLHAWLVAPPVTVIERHRSTLRGTPHTTLDMDGMKEGDRIRGADRGKEQQMQIGWIMGTGLGWTWEGSGQLETQTRNNYENN